MGPLPSGGGATRYLERGRRVLSGLESFFRVGAFAQQACDPAHFHDGLREQTEAENPKGPISSKE